MRALLGIIGAALMIGAPGSADTGRLALVPAVLLTLTGAAMIYTALKLRRNEK